MTARHALWNACRDGRLREHAEGSITQVHRAAGARDRPAQFYFSPRGCPSRFSRLESFQEFFAPMKDLSIALDNRPGALADMGDALGRAGVSVEGGGAWVVDGRGAAHFLVEDAAAARRALQAAGIEVVGEREVLIQKLNQDQPGQLGKLTRRMAQAGVNIEVLYSDHYHNLILVVDDMEKGRGVSEAWTREQAERKK